MIKADYLNPLLFCHFETILIFKKEVKLHAKKTPIYKKPHRQSRMESIFTKNGYDATTVDDIIAASKTSKGTFYHYFKGKDALLSSLSNLFDSKYEELAGVIDPNLPSYDKLMFFKSRIILYDRDECRYPFVGITLLLAAGHQRQKIAAR